MGVDPEQQPTSASRELKICPLLFGFSSLGTVLSPLLYVKYLRLPARPVNLPPPLNPGASEERGRPGTAHRQLGRSVLQVTSYNSKCACTLHVYPSSSRCFHCGEKTSASSPSSAIHRFHPPKGETLMHVVEAIRLRSSGGLLQPSIC